MKTLPMLIAAALCTGMAACGGAAQSGDNCTENCNDSTQCMACHDESSIETPADSTCVADSTADETDIWADSVVSDGTIYELRGRVKRCIRRNSREVLDTLTFDAKGHLLRPSGLDDWSIRRNSDGRICHTYEYEWWGENAMCEDMTRHVDFFYDADGRVESEEHSTTIDGWTTTYVYDNNGYRLVKKNSSQIEVCEWRYEYETFDSHGNWTKRTERQFYEDWEVFSDEYYREIQYYE